MYSQGVYSFLRIVQLFIVRYFLNVSKNRCRLAGELLQLLWLWIFFRAGNSLIAHSLIRSFAHSLITHSLIHSFTHSLIHSFTHSLIHSFHSFCSFCLNQMSNCERFAQIGQDKLATVSKSLMSLISKERPWANHSGPSWQMGDRERFAQVAHDKWANERFAQKILAKKI